MSKCLVFCLTVLICEMSSAKRQSNLFSFFQKKPKDEPAEEGANKEQREEQVGRENLPQRTVQQRNSASKATPKQQKQKRQAVTPLRRQQNQSGNERQSVAANSAEQPILVDSEDEGSRGVGFMSCANSSSSSTPASSKPASKRRRVILSSDEEEEGEGETTKIVEEEMEEEEEEKENERQPSTTPNRGRTQRKKTKRESTEEEGDEQADEPEPESKSNRTPKTPSAKGNASSVGAFAQSFIDSFSVDAAAGDETTNSTPLPNKIAEISGRRKAADEEKDRDDADGGERFPHLDFEFLKADKIRDANGRRPDQPEYDSRTLKVPENFLKQQTPGHRQWWKLKSEHFDTVLFFKVGKFYELFHMDAVIAVENLGLTYMRSKIAHCGFPEVGYGRFADQLVNRGYKVARIEQTETPQQLSERQSKSKMDQEKEKVVRREICRITTQGTKTYGIQDGTDSRELDGTADPNPNYLMAIAESTSAPGSVRYGLCFVDCSIGTFQLSEFDDDPNQSNLRTLLAHNYPSQLLFGKGSLSGPTMALLGTMLSTVPKEALLPKRQFRSAESTLTTLCDDNYFGANLSGWPEAVRETLASPDAAIPSASEHSKLCLSSLGAILWYLKLCLVDVDIVSMRRFSKYTPPSAAYEAKNADAQAEESQKNVWRGKHMVLDGISLVNLHIVPSLSVGGGVPSPLGAIANRLNPTAFSLYNTVNRCQTAFGKRMMRQWVSAPLCDRLQLEARQAAIKWLISEEMRAHCAKMADQLRRVPDLERLFQRIHTIGMKYRADVHPDSRAQLFEADKYNKRKIRDLLIVLDDDVRKLMGLFEGVNLSTKTRAPSLLNECLTRNFAAMKEDLVFFKNAFDRQSALELGMILPRKGVDEEYDATCRTVDGCKTALQGYLSGVARRLKCAPKFVGTGRNAYQIELPDAACRGLGDSFQLTSQRKGFKRYTTLELQKLVDRLNDAEAQCAVISAEVTRRVFADFDGRKNKWTAVVQQMATFDCLLALSFYAQNSAQKMVFPEFVFDFDKPFINIQRGFHPSLVDAKSANFDYIPNSCVLGGRKTAHTMLLTGPNMGGKSTFMRQVASLAVLAQIGSMVPADSMRLTPVDRIFCRIGASDRISTGQSTFFVELSETNTILRQATQNSLVLIDELGRGTSTYDGTAIACAVLKHITRNIRCRTLFSTHYHSLCNFVANEPTIEFAHMACMVENANLDDPTMEAITFLYTLADGMCDKSYGFYTAKMAGLNTEVVRKAFQSSKFLGDDETSQMNEKTKDRKTEEKMEEM